MNSLWLFHVSVTLYFAHSQPHHLLWPPYLLLVFVLNLNISLLLSYLKSAWRTDISHYQLQSSRSSAQVLFILSWFVCQAKGKDVVAVFSCMWISTVPSTIWRDYVPQCMTLAFFAETRLVVAMWFYSWVLSCISLFHVSAFVLTSHRLCRYGSVV